jgi:lipoic acid synthetase
LTLIHAIAKRNPEEAEYPMTTTADTPRRRAGKPPWLKRRLPSGPTCEQVRSLLRRGRLHTVCQEACCPNLWECFSQKTSTFMILGATCTRDCRFCAVSNGQPAPPDPQEPRRVAQAAADLGLTYVVVTSVTRDDLTDGGAGLFADTIRALRRKIAGVRVEVLIPDFKGDAAALRTVLDAGPDVLNHNVETVRRLYPAVRPQADYGQSLRLLERCRRWAPHIPAKSGLMLGLGETDDELRATLADLRQAGCAILTLGQYLQPSPAHLPVACYVAPEAFRAWRDAGLAMGFSEVSAGPFVRSSYHARESYLKATPPGR